MSQHFGAIDPGWYPDPKGMPQERYWDGHSWTDHTRPMTIVLPPKRKATETPRNESTPDPTDD
ncbi:MAG: DUF2510 domain-containing protein [Candidatus Nanopelagicales bacterium]